MGGNLKNKHSFKYSTLANSKAIGLERTEDGVVLSTKLKTKKSPKGMFKKVTLKRDFRRVAKSIKGACAGYRPDLEKDACTVDSHSPQPWREEEGCPREEVAPWQQVNYHFRLTYKVFVPGAGASWQRPMCFDD